MSNRPVDTKELSADAAVMLNLGCGRRFHPTWRNVDFAPLVDGVIVHNLTKPLPFEDGSADACYTAHVIGHLRGDDSENFLREQNRVLKPGGVARFAVPDLAQVASNYVEILEGLLSGDRTREADYDWIQIELYDQVARTESGGQMAKYLCSGNVPNRDFVLGRIGEEGGSLMDNGLVAEAPPSLLKRLRRGNLGRYFSKARLKAAAMAAGVIAGSDAKRAFEEGVFRSYSGEVQWRVYDAFSLGRALENAGFVEPRVCSARESAIPGFATFNFDTDENDVERKPESLYLEATAT